MSSRTAGSASRAGSTAVTPHCGLIMSRGWSQVSLSRCGVSCRVRSGMNAPGEVEERALDAVVVGAVPSTSRLRSSTFTARQWHVRPGAGAGRRTLAAPPGVVDAPRSWPPG
ncbi:hypothetical protein [Pseudonocardia sp.]|uniref:hypothetical protein n=1 Tax=Pseudonocardia sp. TaxID=60912 RepID=UPI003D14766C